MVPELALVTLTGTPYTNGDEVLRNGKNSYTPTPPHTPIFWVQKMTSSHPAVFWDTTFRTETWDETYL